MTLVDAVIAALKAGAVFQPLPRPRRLLCPPPSCWASSANQDAVLAVLNADPWATSQCLAVAQDVAEELLRERAGWRRGADGWWRRPDAEAEA